METVYLGLGGNIGDTYATLNSVIAAIRKLPGVKDVEVSPFYKTTPVSSIPQSDFINAVCRLKTRLEPRALLELLQDIEVKHGKVPKPKDAPRKVDIDILFFGDKMCDSADLQVPHPRWRERLFVLVPLSDMTTTAHAPGQIDIKSLINAFPLVERQQIIKEKLCNAYQYKSSL